ncbi:MAG: hypothetical protein DRI79_03555 [Chloroflexi bacterium]|nr:MAG: hypothetical protein DRI80_19745 [Chloroflexota bacterium]RLC91177.1 MAG: hypothetical protein DRI79_03555 [Chloroflexota bacterium]
MVGYRGRPYQNAGLTTLPTFRYHKPTMERDRLSLVDLAPYTGRWVALVHGRVAGVGWTAEEARRAAKRSRPKEEPEVVFVPPVEVPDGKNSLDRVAANNQRLRSSRCGRHC